MSNKITELYEQFTFEGFKCLYGPKEELTTGFPLQEIKFNEVKDFEFDNHMVIMADTHDYDKLDEVIESFNGKVDTLIHAGDFGTPETTMKSLKKFDGNFYGVLGNHDRQFSAAYLPYLNYKFQMGYLTKRFLINSLISVHLRHENEGLENLVLESPTMMQGLIIFGHSHKPVFFHKRRMTVINPGILCDVGNNKPTMCLYSLNNPTESVFVVEG